MPIINNIATDSTITDGDKLLGIDGANGRSTKTYEIGELKEYISDTPLDGVRAGRLLTSYENDFVETALKASVHRDLLADGTGTEEDDTILATSSTVLNVGSAINSVVFATDKGPDGDEGILENDIIVITNETTGKRDFGVVDSANSGTSTITLKSTDTLADFTNFQSSNGYANKVELFRYGRFTLQGDLVILGELQNEEGENIAPDNPVLLAGSNTFTAGNTFQDDAIFEEGVTIGTGSNLFHIPNSDSAPVANQVLAITDDSDDNSLELTTIGALLPFGTAADTIATWAEGNYSGSDNIPSAILPIATDSVLGVVKEGANVTIGSDGTITTSNDTGTFNIATKTGSETDYTDNDNLTDLQITGTAVTVLSDDGTTLELEIDSGSPHFEAYAADNAAGSVVDWAQSNNSDRIPSSKLTIATDSVQGVASFGTGLSITNGAVTVANTIPTLAKDNIFTGNNTIANATGATLNLQRMDEDVVSGESLGFINHEGWSNETNASDTELGYVDFARIESKFVDDGMANGYQYGRYIISTNYVQKGQETPALTTLEAITIDRTGITHAIDSTFTGSVTIGDDADDTLSVAATASFDESITGAITELVNNRDNTETYKFWVGKSSDAPHVAKEISPTTAPGATGTSIVFTDSEFSTNSSSYTTGTKVYITDINDPADYSNVEATVSSLSGNVLTLTITANSLGNSLTSDEYNVGLRDPFTIYNFIDEED